MNYENGDLLADSRNILKRWKNGFLKALIVHRVSDVRQVAIHTVVPLVPDLRPFDFEIAVAKLKNYKLPVIDQILAEAIEARIEIYCLRFINLLILF
jgi:hypothetical protein